MSDCQQKIINFSNALRRLKEGVEKLNQADDLLRDGVIQRFEFTFELAWKSLKACFEEEGIMNLNSPKAVLIEAFAASLFNDDELWLQMLRDRNLTVHIYNEEQAIAICQSIQHKYLPALEDLLQKIQGRNS
ncbi:MAG: nucleotidyltransferase substrate binding protein [Desulfitobacteriia bacterium]|jgi:nucleotidyltransferase substrate binding protein (TIGR01987 family)